MAKALDYFGAEAGYFNSVVSWPFARSSFVHIRGHKWQAHKGGAGWISPRSQKTKLKMCHVIKHRE